jgi:hypothetical protein
MKEMLHNEIQRPFLAKILLRSYYMPLLLIARELWCKNKE